MTRDDVTRFLSDLYADWSDALEDNPRGSLINFTLGLLTFGAFKVVGAVMRFLF